ncbi:hypothetical protein T8S45_09500 [Blastomonas marina]|uniref:hypothetical protein n=1 Tax=Blastomonas marina TaxID=1867408 RepID=UPI002AC980C3|nr:hypothetical protein [Blastomonas marina]WPZ03076.1 hypothetical protein T8S45_09500 [Blastomonas marina]
MLVGLVGASGAGKTAIAEALVQGHGFYRVHIGQPIKDMLGAFGLNNEELHGPPNLRAAPSQKLAGKSPRFAMQTLGTEWGREMISKNIWADHLHRRLNSLQRDRVSEIIVDDLRFPEDFEAILGAGGVVVRVIRPALHDAPSTAEKIARKFPLTRHWLRRLGQNVDHETEVHWRTAPAAFEIINDCEPEVAAERLLAAYASERRGHQQNR